MFAGNTYSSDCFELAGRDYKIDPDLLRAISWHESRNRVNAIGINPVTGYGSGLMQIDSQHFKELSRYGIKPEHLGYRPVHEYLYRCVLPAIAFKKWGVTWRAVGAYNAGFRNTEEQERRRKIYATKIQNIYRNIKNKRGY